MQGLVPGTIASTIAIIGALLVLAGAVVCARGLLRELPARAPAAPARPVEPALGFGRPVGTR